MTFAYQQHAENCLLDHSGGAAAPRTRCGGCCCARRRPAPLLKGQRVHIRRSAWARAEHAQLHLAVTTSLRLCVNLLSRLAHRQTLKGLRYPAYAYVSMCCMSRAPEPCDVLWKATGETGWRRVLGPVATVAATCLLLALSFALQYGLAAAAAHQSDGRCALRTMRLRTVPRCTVQHSAQTELSACRKSRHVSTRERLRVATLCASLPGKEGAHWCMTAKGARAFCKRKRPDF